MSIFPVLGLAEAKVEAQRELLPPPPQAAMPVNTCPTFAICDTYSGGTTSEKKRDAAIEQLRCEVKMVRYVHSEREIGCWNWYGGLETDTLRGTTTCGETTLSLIDVGHAEKDASTTSRLERRPGTGLLLRRREFRHSIGRSIRF